MRDPGPTAFPIARPRTAGGKCEMAYRLRGMFDDVIPGGNDPAANPAAVLGIERYDRFEDAKTRLERCWAARQRSGLLAVGIMDEKGRLHYLESDESFGRRCFNQIVGLLAILGAISLLILLSRGATV